MSLLWAVCPQHRDETACHRGFSFPILAAKAEMPSSAGNCDYTHFIFYILKPRGIRNTRRRTESQFLRGSRTDTALRLPGPRICRGSRGQRPHRSRRSVWTFPASAGALANFLTHFFLKFLTFGVTQFLRGEENHHHTYKSVRHKERQ